MVAKTAKEIINEGKRGRQDDDFGTVSELASKKWKKMTPEEKAEFNYKIEVEEDSRDSGEVWFFDRPWSSDDTSKAKKKIEAAAKELHRMGVPTCVMSCMPDGHAHSSFWYRSTHNK